MKKRNAVTTPTTASQAQELLDKLRALRESVPNLELPHGQRPKTIRPVAAIPDDFLEATSVAVDSSPMLKAATSFNSETARDTVTFSTTFANVAEEAETLARAIRNTIASRRYETATDALQTYEIAKALARKPDGAALVPHINEMRRTLGRGPRRRKSPTPPATP